MKTDPEIPVLKDAENECPIPTVWRSAFVNIVKALIKKDYRFESCPEHVSPISKETADQIEKYIENYGEELIELSEETWESSVCIWMESHWNVIVDLWTVNEGRSDLILGARVLESDDSYVVHVDMVYVP